MAWPSKMIVATRNYGVFYTEDFVSPATQPYWTKIIDGLPTITPSGSEGITSFSADGKNPALCQYAMGTWLPAYPYSTLYRRYAGAAWEPCFSVPTTLGAYFPGAVRADPKVAGRVCVIAASFESAGLDQGGSAALLYFVSDNYGATWSQHSVISSGSGGFGYGGYSAYPNMAVYDDNVFAFATRSVYDSYWGWTPLMFLYTKPSGSYTWNETAWYDPDAYYRDWYSRSTPWVLPHNPAYAYISNKVAWTGFSKVSNAGVVTPVVNDGNLNLGDGTTSFWVDASDTAKQVMLVPGSYMYYTEDSWATYTPSYDYYAYATEMYISQGSNINNIILGGHRGRVVVAIDGFLTGEFTYIVGTNWNVPPYDGSIPTTDNPRGIVPGGLVAFDDVSLYPPPEVHPGSGVMFE